MFKIEINKSGKLGLKDEEDTTMSEAIQSIYNFDDELIIFWNNIQINISLNYDLCDMWNDIITMLNAITYHQENVFQINWPSQTFFVTWEFEVENNDIKITAFGNQLQKNEKLDDAENVLFVNKKLFVSEWIKVVNQVKKDLSEQGYDISKLIKNNPFLGIEFTE